MGQEYWDQFGPQDLADMKAEFENRCPATGDGTGTPCCDRAGEYNGFGSDGPLIFKCPLSCPCHD